MSWSLDDEIKLFHGLMFFKPVGLDRNFQMICLAHRLQSKENVTYSVKNIWGHLNKLYNLEELNDSEVIPFPHKTSEFSLPDEFKELKSISFPRVVPSTASSYLSSSAGSSNRQKIKPEENPLTPAVSSPSISPRSVSSPSSASTGVVPPPPKRTRKSKRPASDRDMSMPPPISTSPAKGTPVGNPHSSRKSIRRQH